MNTQIVQIASDGEPRASTEDIASGYGLQHASVIKLVRRYAGDLASFGEVRFEIRLTQQGTPREYALLNERQAVLLLTLMRNTVKVVKFKVQLIQQFSRMAAALENRDTTRWERRIKFEAKDSQSRALGSHGSKLMHTRRKEKPLLEADRLTFIADMEPPLFVN